MAAEDLKHLFPDEEESESKKNSELDKVEELHFNTGSDKTESMEFTNLPESKVGAPLGASSDMLVDILSKLNRLDSVNDKFNDYKVNSLVEAKLLDKNATKLLQRIMQKSPDAKTEVLSIKKMITDYIKSIS